MTTLKKDNDITGGSPAPQTEERQTEPNDPAPTRQATMRAVATQDVTVLMGFIAASLAISRSHIPDPTTLSSIALFILLQPLIWIMGNYVVHMHRFVRDHHDLPWKRNDCHVASVLAICAWVLYHEGKISWAFFTYQAMSCYWIGYWLEWWTGIVALLFSVFNTGNPSTLGRHDGAQSRIRLRGTDGDGIKGELDTRDNSMGRFLVYLIGCFDDFEKRRRHVESIRRQQQKNAEKKSVI
ncbi:hypothetical protein PG996_010453 [Apiospora saccharicola]|uniref:Uncharacterized protein n=1 Tax=Apiospora saccharicola TaxID=335842 RepID=A0ABR1UNL6_9PEZI